MDHTLQKTIKNAVIALTAVLVLVALFLVMRVADLVGVSNENEYNTITVEGDHEVFAAPDIATVSFSVRAENLDLVKAQEQAETSAASAIAGLKNLGIDEKDIQTTYYNASPRYEWDQKCGQYGCETGERKLVGYEVNETVTIKIRDLSKVSGAIGALGGAKVSDIQGPNFDIENRDELVQEAREVAIKEAKEKAKVLAKELGVRLGKIVSYYDGGYGYPMPYMAKGGMDADMAVREEMAQSAPAANPTISEGENRIYSNVSIVYKIR